MNEEWNGKGGDQEDQGATSEERNGRGQGQTSFTAVKQVTPARDQKGRSVNHQTTSEGYQTARPCKESVGETQGRSRQKRLVRVLPQDPLVTTKWLE